MRIIRWSVFLLLAGAFCGPGLQATDPGERADLSAPGTKATVYFYRYKQFMGSALEPSVYADGVELARMDNGRFFAAQLDPGQHIFYSNDNQSVQLDLQGGEDYFIRVDIAPGAFKAYGHLVAVPPEQGAFDIQKLKPLGSDKVKDRARVVITAGDVSFKTRRPASRSLTDTQPSSAAPTVATPAPAPTSTQAPAPTAAPPPPVAVPAAAQPAPAPAPEPEELSTVVLKSTPDGADVTVDGKFVGNTPSTVRLTPGDHRIAIEKAGYRTWQRTMTVNPGGIVTVDATLEKMP